MLSTAQLHKLIDDGVISALHSNVNDIAVDVHLGNSFLVESMPSSWGRVVNLVRGEKPNTKLSHIEDGQQFFLPELGFCNALTKEFFNMPDDLTGMFFMKSSQARVGLDHSHSILIKPGWKGSLVLELSNRNRWHELMIEPGMPIGQVIFFHHSQASGYAGIFNNQLIIGES